MTIDIISTILIGTVFQSMMLAAALFAQPKQRQKGLIYLALLMGCVAILLGEFLLLHQKVVFLDPHNRIMFFGQPVYFLFGPLYYLYARTIQGKSGSIRFYQLIHFIPAILLFINALPIWFSLPTLRIVEGYIVLNHGLLLNISGYWIMGFHLGQTILYCLLVWRLLIQAEAICKERVSDEPNIGTQWLMRLNRIFITLLIVQVCALLFLIFKSHIAKVEYAMAISLALFVEIVAFSSIRHPVISEDVPGNDDQPKTIRYEKSALSPELAMEYLQHLEHLMVTHKPYRKSDLKLRELAEMLDISPNHLSQVINQEAGVNFFDFVNSYRVSEAKQLLVNPVYQHYSHLAIAMEAGFNNKTSFNRIFKKQVGQTPSGYVRLHHQMQ